MKINQDFFFLFCLFFLFLLLSSSSTSCSYSFSSCCPLISLFLSFFPSFSFCFCFFDLEAKEGRPDDQNTKQNRTTVTKWDPCFPFSVARTAPGVTVYQRRFQRLALCILYRLLSVFSMIFPDPIFFKNGMKFSYIN